jgi:S-adenosylmethionine synthetase
VSSGWMVRASEAVPPGQQGIEIVERKGLGHPDTLCDGIAEHVSRALCHEYLERFGSILHHNVDKVLLVGGRSRAVFGGGAVEEPIEVYLAGRATEAFGGKTIPVADIAVQACREWLARNVRHLDVERDVVIVPRLRPGSPDLTALYRRGASPPANDTSCGVGFAPPSDLERIVLAVERALTAPATLAAHPAVGEDVKVMGLRRHEQVSLTIGCALVARHVSDLETYCAATACVREIALSAAREVSALPTEVVVNAGDDPDRGEIFLTVTGTSAESGDDGEVGRGNRANGLITPYRPMTLEAAAGKNPVSHVGKVYNVAATRIAEVLVSELEGVDDATCVLLSRIGAPVAEPELADVQLGTGGEPLTDALRARGLSILREQLSRMEALRDDIVAGRVGVY